MLVALGEIHPKLAVVYTRAESKQSINKASGSTACPAGQATYVIFDSTQSKAGVACATTSSAVLHGLTLK